MTDSDPDNFQDKDIARLLANTDKTPAELDLAILAAARQTVEAETQRTESIVQPWYLNKVFQSGFAVAAVLVLTVVLVPLLSQDPEADLSVESMAGLEASRDVNEEVDQVVVQVADQEGGQQAELTLAAESMPTPAVVAEQSANELEALYNSIERVAMVEPEFVADSAIASRSVEALRQKQSTKPSPDNEFAWRETAATWLQHIQQLLQDNKRDLARQEMQRFKTAHPDWRFQTENE